MRKQLLTPKGKQKLEAELLELKQKRIKIAKNIKDAKELGDLSENAEYHSAKEEQGFTEGRIIEIKSLLKSATLVHPQTSSSAVVLGSTITTKSDLGTASYEIVGINEADPASGKISVNSPMGKAFLNAKKNDIIEVNTPSGKINFTLLSIK